MSDALVPTNGHGPEAAAALATVDAPAFKPSTRDWAYLRAVEDILATSGRLTAEELATRLPKRVEKDPTTGEEVAKPLTRQGVWKMQQRPGFLEWVGAQLRAQTDREWPAVIRRATTLALRGSIDHMTFLAKVRGEFRDTPPASPAAAGQVLNNSGVIVHIHE